MSHSTGTMQTSDHLMLHTETWLPDGAVKAVVVIVHGYAEHIGRYAHVGYALLKTGKRLREQAVNLKLPLLVLHGGDDRLTPVSGAEIIYQRAASADKTLKIYPGLYHEVVNEPEKATVLDDMTAWLDSR